MSVSRLIKRRTYVAGDVVESGANLSRGAIRGACPFDIFWTIGWHRLENKVRKRGTEGDVYRCHDVPCHHGHH